MKVMKKSTYIQVTYPEIQGFSFFEMGIFNEYITYLQKRFRSHYDVLHYLDEKKVPAANWIEEKICLKDPIFVRKRRNSLEGSILSLKRIKEQNVYSAGLDIILSNKIFNSLFIWLGIKDIFNINNLSTIRDKNTVTLSNLVGIKLWVHRYRPNEDDYISQSYTSHSTAFIKIKGVWHYYDDNGVRIGKALYRLIPIADAPIEMLIDIKFAEKEVDKNMQLVLYYHNGVHFFKTSDPSLFSPKTIKAVLVDGKWVEIDGKWVEKIPKELLDEKGNFHKNKTIYRIKKESSQYITYDKENAKSPSYQDLSTFKRRIRGYINIIKGGAKMIPSSSEDIDNFVKIINSNLYISGNFEIMYKETLSNSHFLEKDPEVAFFLRDVAEKIVLEDHCSPMLHYLVHRFREWFSTAKIEAMPVSVADDTPRKKHRHSKGESKKRGEESKPGSNTPTKTNSTRKNNASGAKANGPSRKKPWWYGRSKKSKKAGEGTASVATK
jgi:hypothetical protein